MGEFPTWATTRVDQVVVGRVLSGVSNVVSPRLASRLARSRR